MAKYKIIPSSRNIVQSPVSIGHKAEKGVEAIEFDVTAWVETYGSGTATIVMKRWGDSIPYPVALEIDENNKATWTLSDTDTAKAGMAYAQLSYIVGDEVVKKSDIYAFRVMDSLTGEGETPEAYESWLEHLTHLAAEAMAEVLDIEGVVTDKTLSIEGGIADAKATGEALAEKVDASDYSTLSAQVDTNTEDIGELKADLSNEVGVFTWVNAKYIDLTTDPVSLTPVSNNIWRHTVVDCVAGDKFVINATGGNAPRAWGFIDSGNHILSVANAQATVVDLELTAPTNAVKLIISDKSGGMSYKVGNNLASKVGNLEKIEAGIPEDVKAALLACLDKVLWKDGASPSCYNALENALYPNNYPKITASFNSGANTIYTDNTLSSLKQYLTVKYYESSESAGVTVSSENYALTGALVAGTSVVYVSYNNLVCSFTIYNVVDFYNTWKWETQLGQITAYQGTADPNQTDTTKYPSRVLYKPDNYQRRIVGTSRGKRPCNVYNQTGVNSNVYPIPVPANATKYTIKVAPTSSPYYVFCHVLEYVNNAYGDSISDYRTTWTRCSEESPVEKNITGHPANAFMIVNIKYDSAGTTNPPIPDNVTIEFSED